MSTATPKASVKAQYEAGEKILCFHGDLLYTAKCTQVEVEGKTHKYFVHYEGWNKKWDDWVPESRIVKLNEAGLKKQNELLEKYGSSKGKKGLKTGPMALKEGTGSRCSTPVSLDGTKQKSSRASTGSDSAEPRKKKSRLADQQQVETAAKFKDRAEVKVKLPEELKKLLVDDWDLVTRQFKLVTLPCKITIRQILADYVKSKSSVKGISPAKISTVEEVVKGITAYFNELLGTQLLYKFERLQYAELLQADKEKQQVVMSEVYGFIHLLRLFVRLGNMLAYTSLSEKNINMVLAHVQDLLKYLQKNQATLFSLDDYGVASPDYQRRAFT